MAKAKRQRSGRERLYHKNPFCHYCGCKTRLKPGFKKGGGLHDITATKEHLYTNMDIRRLLVTEEENLVIACYKCNQTKGNTDNQAFIAAYAKRGEIKEIDIRQFALPPWKYYIRLYIRKVIKFLTN